MRYFRRIAALAAAASLLAFGSLAAGPGAAQAAPTAITLTVATAVTGCPWGNAGADGGLFPSCTSTGTINYPTNLMISVDPGRVLAPIFGVLLPLLGGITVHYSGTCQVNGAAKPYSGSYTIANAAQLGTRTLNLQALVGSPVPNACTITVSIGTVFAPRPILNLLPVFRVNTAVTSVVNIPGTTWTPAGTTSSGASAAVCADVTANGNAGTPIQAFTCLGALSSFWSATGTGQFVHNGDCLTASGGGLTALRLCTVNNNNQRWTGGTTKTQFVNQALGTRSGCLTVPNYANGTRLTLTKCAGKANQLWISPPKTPGSGS